MNKPGERKEPRYPTRAILVKVDGCKHKVFGYARDISRSGMQVRTFSTCMPYPIGVGEKVGIEFRLPECGSDIRCEAEIVWNLNPPGGTFSTMLQGLRFTDIEPAHEEVLSGWINGRSSQG